MNADLEATLAELGPDYRELVAEMKAAYQPLEAGTPAVGEKSRGRILPWTFGYLAAASLLVFLGLGIVFRSESALTTNEFMLAHIKNEAALNEIIRTQRQDGGWDNDFITRQNAAALKASASPEAQIAFRRAMRNLRLRGVL